MHGMINRALQGFVSETYGPDLWAEVAGQAGAPPDGFEAMLHYDDALTLDCFEATCHVLHKPPGAVLEDIGLFLVTHPPLEPLRRLLRFGGGSFLEFLHSLEEIADRGRLAIPDLDLPVIVLEEIEPRQFVLRARWGLPGIGPMLLGSLRAMADDYGALVTLSYDGTEAGEDCLRIQLHDADFAEGRSFSLGHAAP